MTRMCFIRYLSACNHKSAQNKKNPFQFLSKRIPILGGMDFLFWMKEYALIRQSCCNGDYYFK